ncbi:MAG: UDP-N-acetylmuramoyl-tripeptide--D-alanyl-D-alanine ligase, partial [Saprospiraceae bacterium]|nr:UDP-N-acetylmuramoyl-tripeptide--D-alanyl-D-alanine ligase [Saprospiraceae bacterium]
MNVNKFINLLGSNPSVSTDTRTIKEGDVFFALKGDNFNGNQYVLQAIEKGASIVISDDIKWTGRDKVIIVEDVLEFMQKAARVYRASLDCKVIGITGSNGKTTTKELCYEVVRSSFKCYATQGNYNNHIGVPITL